MRFIRKNGRIIPIKDKYAGAGALATGIAAGAGAGGIASRVMIKSAIAHNEAVNHFKDAKSVAPLLKSQAKISRVYGNKSMAISKTLERNAFAIRGAGQATSAALIGAGVYAIMGRNKKQNQKTRTAVSAGIGIASSAAIHSTYLRGMGHRGFGLIKATASRLLRAKLF